MPSFPLHCHHIAEKIVLQILLCIQRITSDLSEGARFAKWRSPLVIDMEKKCPTDLAIKANMHDLARYALICQSEGLMPIVEPDISLSGKHTLEEAIDVNIRVQSELFKAMIDHGVYMAGSTLKPNIVNPGRDCPKSYSVEEIAEANSTTCTRIPKNSTKMVPR